MFQLQNRACSFMIIFSEQPVKALVHLGHNSEQHLIYLYVSSIFNMEDKTHKLILNLHKKEPTKVIYPSVAPIPQHQAI